MLLKIALFAALALTSASAIALDIGVVKTYQTMDAACEKKFAHLTCKWNVITLDELKILLNGTTARIMVGSVSKAFVPALANSIELTCGSHKLGKHTETLSKSSFKTFILNSETTAACDGDLMATVTWHGGLMKTSSIEDSRVMLMEEF
jgi:hypothetical protein